MKKIIPLILLLNFCAYSQNYNLKLNFKDGSSVTVSVDEIQRLDFDDSSIPVELISFSATSSNNEVFIQWSTASETNNSGFEVQRRAWNDFERIGFVPGNGTSTVVNHYQFRDCDLITGNLTYRLKQINFGGAENYSNEIIVEIKVPDKFELQQNYPNPFNPSTLIQYQVPENIFVRLKVFDSLGKEISTIVNEQKNAGKYSFIFSGQGLSSGVYFYVFEAGDFISMKKMILIK